MDKNTPLGRDNMTSPLLQVFLWKDINLAGDRDNTTRIEARWHDDYESEDEVRDLVDIRIIQDSSITNKGISLSRQGWQQLANEVGDLMAETDKVVQRIVMGQVLDK